MRKIRPWHGEGRLHLIREGGISGGFIPDAASPEMQALRKSVSCTRPVPDCSGTSEVADMLNVRFIRRCFSLFVILMCIHSALAETTLFVGTDRHAKYETISEESRIPRRDEGKKPPREKSPVYDPDGNLIWHNRLTEVLNRVYADGIVPDVVLLGGDFVGDGSDKSLDVTGYPMGAPFFSMKSVEAQIRHVFGNAVQCLFTYGSHDRNSTDAYDSVFFSGPVTERGYYIYGISFAQMIFDTDEQAKREKYAGKDAADPNGLSAQTASRHFLDWVSSLEDDLPILIMSHVPLHARRGDNTGAWTWTKALNMAAEQHDILFLWGHNHTLEVKKERKAAEQAEYLKMPGESLTVQSVFKDDKGEFVKKAEDELVTRTEPLRFLYMNAGYITEGAGTVLTFADADDDGHWDDLTVRRYLDEGETRPWTVQLRR